MSIFYEIEFAKYILPYPLLVKNIIIPERAVMESRCGPHKAPFIGELAAKGGLRG